MTWIIYLAKPLKMHYLPLSQVKKTKQSKNMLDNCLSNVFELSVQANCIT